MPYLGVFVYLIARGDSMGKRQASDAQASQDAMQAYIRDAAGGSAGELATLAELHSNGKLSDDEYARAKAKSIG